MDSGLLCAKLNVMKVTFPLTITDTSARLAITADGPLDPKDYVLKLRFPGVDSTREVAQELRLYFSDGLGALYLYNHSQRESQTGHTKFFRLPPGVDSLTVEVERWSKKRTIAQIERLDLQVQAPWSRMNKITQIGIATYGS